MDLRVAGQIAAHLQSSQDLPLVILTPPGASEDELLLQLQAERLPVEAGLEAVKAQLQAGDLVIVPVATMRRAIGSRALSLSDLSAPVSILVAAGPHRLRLTTTKTTQEAEMVFSFGS